MKIRFKKAYSLVEMIIYVAILSIISLAFLNTLVSFTRSYSELSALRNVEHSAISSLERMARDIRDATAIDYGNSTWNSNPGILTLNQNIDGVTTVKKFYVSEGKIMIDINGQFFGPLTAENSEISSLVFRQMDSGVSKAVKIDMTITSTVKNSTKTKNYQTMVVLRGK